MAKKKTEPTGTPTLTTAELNRAATNSPVLSPDKFQLGDRTFPLLDLAYEDYIAFITLLTPLIDAIVGGVSSRMGLAEYGLTESPQFSSAAIFKYCAQELPEMARLVCKQSAPEITTDEIKKMAKSPFQLANVVLLQVKRNNIIKELSDFFGSIVPLLRTVNPQK